MAWYEGTYSCGHEGRVNIIGPHKDREWKKEREFSKMCPDCWEKHLEEERKKKNEEAAKKAKEMDLPELEGSEKQVAWANTLRQKVIDKIEAIDEDDLKFAGLKLSLNDIKIIEDYILHNRTKAKYYIDNRYDNVFDFIKRDMEEALKSDEERMREKLEKERELEIKAEATIYPEKQKYNKVAEIKVDDEMVSVSYPKNDDFYNIVKNELNFKWNYSKTRWEKYINFKTGTAEDRAAELGNKLLNAGFPVMIFDPRIRKKAISADYEPEHSRWIAARVKGKHKGWFSISWDYDDDMYSKARSLPESKWSSPNVVVKSEYFNEIEEFANLYDFRFSPGAKRLLKEAKEKDKLIKEKAMKVNPNKKSDTKEHKDGLKEILNSEAGILDDLRDD